MSKSPRFRHVVLAVLLVGSIVAAVAMPGGDSDEVVVARSAPAEQRSLPKAPEAAAKHSEVLLALTPRGAAGEPVELFRVVGAAVSPAVPATVVTPPPPPPVVPPLPFKYLGLIDGGQTRSVLLSIGGNDIVVRAGERPEGAGASYRVDEITDAAITFTYLPLNERQTLKIGESN